MFKYNQDAMRKDKMSRVVIFECNKCKTRTELDLNTGQGKTMREFSIVRECQREIYHLCEECTKKLRAFFNGQ